MPELRYYSLAIAIYIIEMKTDSYSETDLIERARQDLNAFGELVERYRGSIQRQCYSRTLDWQHAEDLAQEVFIRAYLKFHQLSNPELFPNWLRRIATNVCNEFLRSPARREVAAEIREDQIATSDASAAIPSQLDTLPARTRLCLGLFYDQQMSYAEIAGALEMSVNSVKSRLARAKAVLRKEMAEMNPSNRSPFTQRVIEKLEQLQSTDPAEREQAAQAMRTALGKDLHKRTLTRLRGDVTSSDPEPCCEDERAWIIEREIRNSRRYRTPEVRDALVDLMLHHDHEEIRMKAAGALAAQRDSSVIPSLRRAIDDPKNPREVVSAAKSTMVHLQKLAPAPAPDREQSVLRSDLDTAARDPRARFELMRRLVTALGDPSARVRSQSVRALAELGDKRAAPSIAGLLENDPVPGVRQASAIALGKLGSPRGVPALIDVVLQSQDQRLVRPAVLALTMIGDHRAVPAVLDLLNRSRGDNNTLHAGMRLLIKLATAEDIGAIKDIVQNFHEQPDERQREFADSYWLAVLARHADERNEADLVAEIIRHPDNNELPRAVGRAVGIQAVDTLRHALESHGNEGAARALLHLGLPGFEILKEALRDGSEKAKEAACYALCFDEGPAVVARAGDTGLVDLLETMSAAGPTLRIRFYAAGALFSISRPSRWRER